MSGHFLCTWTNITAPKIPARGKPPMISSFFFFFFFDNCESLGQFEVNYRRKSPFKKKIYNRGLKRETACFHMGKSLSETTVFHSALLLSPDL